MKRYIITIREKIDGKEYESSVAVDQGCLNRSFLARPEYLDKLIRELEKGFPVTFDK